MDLGLSGKKALILASSQGIGLGVARALANEGAHVAISSRDPARLEKAAREIGAKAWIQADLSKPGEGAWVVREAVAKLGGLEILVTNAGGPPKGMFTDLGTREWTEGFQGLWLSATESIEAALPLMRQIKRGRILLITSLAAKLPLTGLTISNGLRAGLSGLVRSACTELAPDGITINAILPGYTRTERLVELGQGEDELKRKVPAGRLADPLEIGSLACFLSSDQASYITGQSIVIDGGVTHGI